MHSQAEPGNEKNIIDRHGGRPLPIYIYDRTVVGCYRSICEAVM